MTPQTPGLGLSAWLGLQASIDGLAAQVRREADWRQRVAGIVQQVPFAQPMAINAGAGSIDQPDLLKAKTGFYWSVRRVFTTGYSAGTVLASRDLMEPLWNFTVAAPFTTFGKGEMLLPPDSRLTFAATGITGTVTVWGVADCFPTWYLPFYIG
jgi:hypothetical protein